LKSGLRKRSAKTLPLVAVDPESVKKFTEKKEEPTGMDALEKSFDDFQRAGDIATFLEKKEKTEEEKQEKEDKDKPEEKKEKEEGELKKETDDEGASSSSSEEEPKEVAISIIEEQKEKPSSHQHHQRHRAHSRSRSPPRREYRREYRDRRGGRGSFYHDRQERERERHPQRDDEILRLLQCMVYQQQQIAVAPMMYPTMPFDPTNPAKQRRLNDGAVGTTNV